ncbi:MAG: DUF1844 domain-containing protein [Candidatus Omnitrophica bacterium]|nr:DUF1844 domain-containing protein [Candidatus Omnitrophota bacterium]
MSKDYKLNIEKKVDETWKSQVEKEKERIRSDEPKRSQGNSGPSQPAQKETAGEQERQGPGSESAFQIFISSLGIQTLMHLGELPNPMTQQPELQMDQAKHMMDILEMLQQKTKGNLTSTEAQLLDDLLYELRMKYIARIQAISEPPPGAAR